MSPLLLLIAAAAVALLSLAVASAAVLKAWTGWLEVRRMELGAAGADRPDAGGRELLDLRRRVRRLESIASGVDF